MSEVRNIEEAVSKHDFAFLAKALSSGWRIPYKDDAFVSALDLSFPKRCLTEKWSEGFKLLADYHEFLYQDELLFKIALRCGAVEVVSLFLDHGWSGQSPISQPYIAEYEAEDGPVVYENTIYDFCIRLIGRIGDPSYMVTEKELVQIFKMLQDKGQSLLQPHVGDLHKGGFYTPEGKVPWVYALNRSALEVVLGLFPKDWSEVNATPEGLSEIERVHKFQFSEGNQEFKSVLPDYTGKKMAEIWISFIKKNLESYLNHYPEDMYINELDFYSLLEFDLNDRRRIWERWLKKDPTGWSALHQLVHEENHDLIRSVLKLMLEDQAPSLALWNQQDDSEISPEHLWDLNSHKNRGVYLIESASLEDIRQSIWNAVQP